MRRRTHVHPLDELKDIANEVISRAYRLEDSADIASSFLQRIQNLKGKTKESQRRESND